MFIDRILHHSTVYDPWSCGSAYATADGEAGEDVENPNRKIDIDEAGRFLLTHFSTELKNAEKRVPFAEDAARILLDGDYAMSRVLREGLKEEERELAKTESWSTRTKPKFLDTLLLLVSIGLFMPTSSSEIQALTKHFQVPKGEDSWRIISDARIFNWLCRVAPGVNLPLIRTLILEIAALGATYAVTGDWRFWFYQLAINSELQTYFVVSCADRYFRMTCLPMGWSWSPRIAQCIGWGVILHRTRVNGVLEDPLGVYEEWGPDPPNIVHLRACPGGATVGLIVLWYDNVMVVCKEPSLRDKWFERLNLNCKRFNAKIKTMKCEDRPNYIGIHFWTSKGGEVKWCHEAERCKKWKAIMERPIRTPRDVSRCVGVPIWHHTVSLRPLLHMYAALEVLKRVSRVVSTKRAWDRPLEELGVGLSLNEEKILKQFVRQALHNAPCTTDIHKVSCTHYATADACREHVRLDGTKVSGGGWVWYGAAFKPGSKEYQKDRVDWSPEFARESIHILEAQAVLELVRWLPEAKCLSRLVLGEDNTIVVAAISKGYSSCRKTRDIVQELFAECKRKRYVLEVLWVPTKENSADPVSRDEAMEDFRTERSWRILHGEPPLTAKVGKRAREPPASMVPPVGNPYAEELEVALCCIDDEEEL